MSRMSAPSATMRLACSIATFGSRNCPPSENESGVTFSTPITSGPGFANSRPSGSGGARATPPAGEDGRRAIVMPLALRAAYDGVNRLSVGDLERQFLGVLDPAHDRAVGGQHAHEFAPAVGLGHRFGELFRIAVFQFLDRINAGGLQQAGIVFADALDPHPVGGVGPAQQVL